MFLFVSHKIFTATRETDTITNLISQLKKLRLGKVEGLAPSHRNSLVAEPGLKSRQS